MSKLRFTQDKIKAIVSELNAGRVAGELAHRSEAQHTEAYALSLTGALTGGVFEQPVGSCEIASALAVFVYHAWKLACNTLLNGNVTMELSGYA